jgi:hypothetical protein
MQVPDFNGSHDHWLSLSRKDGPVEELSASGIRGLANRAYAQQKRKKEKQSQVSPARSAWPRNNINSIYF